MQTMKFIFLIFLALAPISAWAQQETSDTATPKSVHISLADFLEKGGVVMYPLVALSVIVVILIFFYLLTLRRNAVVSDKFMTTAEALIRKRDYLGMVAFCSRQNQSIARIAEKTLDFMTKNSGVSFKEVREVAEAEGSRQAGMLSQRISYLSDIGAVAPMMGLLGTVIGMIGAFGTMSSQLDEDATRHLAEKIQEALITTASGLVIGIVAVLFYSFFRGRVKKYLAELEAAATHLMALLAAQSNRRSQSLNAQNSPQVPPATIEDDYSYRSHSGHDGPSPIEEGHRDIDGI